MIRWFIALYVIFAIAGLVLGIVGAAAAVEDPCE